MRARRRSIKRYVNVIIWASPGERAAGVVGRRKQIIREATVAAAGLLTIPSGPAESPGDARVILYYIHIRARVVVR